MDRVLLLQALFAGITNGFVYGLIGLGISAIFRGTGIINAMQGEFAVVAAMLTAALIAGPGWPLLPAIAVSVALTSALGLVIERFFVRPLVRRGAGEESFLLLTLGLALLSTASLLFFLGREPQFLPGVGGNTSVSIFGAPVRVHAFAVIALGIVLTVALRFFYTKTVVGIAMVAASLDAEGAATTGINVSALRSATFVIGGFVGAVAGILVAPLTPVSYLLGLTLTLKGFAAAVLGGLTRPLGAIVGGLAFGLIEAFAVVAFPSGYKDVVALTVLVVLLIVRPRGLLPAASVRTAA